MSLTERTKRYATAVAEASLNAFTTQARGDLEAPSGAENVRLYTAKGGSAITLQSTTTSAAVVFDPEVTLRNGQLCVDIYERNTSDVVTDVKRVTLGRPSSDFLSSGVLSSGLKVLNSSGVDVIGGTQSAGVISSVPRDISTITSTDLANFSTDHERDLISGVISREDATMTMSFSNHFGERMALSRTNTLSNTVRRIWDDGQKDGTVARRTTTGKTSGFTVDTNMGLTNAQISSVDANNLLLLDGSAASNAKLFMDSARLDDEYNPLTLATYAVQLDAFLDISGASTPAAADPGYKIDAVAMALDAAGNIITTTELQDRTGALNGKIMVIKFSAFLTSSTVPIHRVVMGARRQNLDQATETVKAGASFNIIEAIEETADIPARNLHVCVFEGLNSSATLNISSQAVLTGIPDSTNVFISSGSGEDDVYDTNAVKIFLRSMSRTLPRAFTVGGHGAMTRKLTAMYGDEELSVSFKAMSFENVAKKVKHLGKLAKQTVKALPGALDEMEEALGAAGSALSLMPGSVGSAGKAMLTASGALRRM
jgi:hypothetical protein